MRITSWQVSLVTESDIAIGRGHVLWKRGVGSLPGDGKWRTRVSAQQPASKAAPMQREFPRGMPDKCREGATTGVTPSREDCSAASYSPTSCRVQYHWRWLGYLPGSG